MPVVDLVERDQGSTPLTAEHQSADARALEAALAACAASDHTHAVTQATEIIIDGGGEVIATGVKGDIKVPFACTITAWEILADQNGTIQFDVWKNTYANFSPTVPSNANTITGGAEPKITSSATNKAQSSSMSGWTTSISAGDILRFNVDSVTNITRATLVLTLSRTIGG